MSKRLKGFTLIELLIVVAIIAILAAIAVPNFLEAQTRSKVSRVKADLRSLATAIESYYIDNNSYPAHGSSDGASPGANSTIPGTLPNARGICTFCTCTNGVTDALLTLTTPISYITSYFSDPFADNRNAVFAYSRNLTTSNGAGWITWSYGPDGDEKKPHATNANAGGDIGFATSSITTVNETSYYNPNATVPSPSLLEATYDPSNGTTSNGDVWRVKQ